MSRVLIVEDNPTWMGILKRYCERAGFEVVEAVSPQAAMDALDETAIDVLLLDMLLATETGMALLNEMRSFDDLATIPIVVCTSVSGMTEEQLAPFGVRAVLDKTTCRPDDIRQALLEVTHG